MDLRLLRFLCKFNTSKNFNGRHPVVLFITEIKSKSVQTQLNPIYYLFTFLPPYVSNTIFEPEDDLK
jgi:hypothetical protein